MPAPDGFTRRGMIVSALASAAAKGATNNQLELRSRLRELEKQSGGRLGCAILDTATDAVVEHRGSDRFPMCSTFKALAAGLVLKRVDKGLERLDRRIFFTEAEMAGYSPISKLRVGVSGMTVEEICHAAVTASDNTAANLMLASFGGPAGFTAFARSIGDPITRLDRTETSLNEAKPGDPRDTTTPAAMAEDLLRLVLGDVLQPASRTMLATWLKANTTGDARLRAGLPSGWVVGDKTGTGDNGVANDIAVVWPRGRAPILVTAYLHQSTGSADDRNKILADVGRAIGLLL